VRAAKEAAAENESYFAGAVEAFLGDALESGDPGGTALLVDPPAEGLSPEVVGMIIKHRPRTLVYVSCDPPTLSRDLKKLGNWYSTSYVQPVDMFPQTAEIEVAAKLMLL
jgi:23S rRNA (uracil1939-C5)-methyltransferase